jgi:hypothetical protein
MESEPAWHKPLFFEDSPSCPKHKYEKCVPEHNCVLMDFVPEASRNESVPCRHIPLNEKHETVEMLAKCGRGKDVEPALRTWLVKTIGELESAAVH